MRRQLDRKAALITGTGALACVLAAACGGSPDGTDGTESTTSQALIGFDAGLFLPPVPSGLPTPAPILTCLPPPPPLPSGLPTPPSLPTLPSLPNFDAGLFLPMLPSGLPNLPFCDAGFPTLPLPSGLPTPPSLPSGARAA